MSHSAGSKHKSVGLSKRINPRVDKPLSIYGASFEMMDKPHLGLSARAMHERWRADD
jgi:hypothetical protein